MTCAEEVTGQVHRHGAVPIVERDRFRLRSGSTDADIVHEDVQPSEPAQDLQRDRMDLVDRRNVANDALGGGTVGVEVKGDRVILRGQAVTVLRGELA